jgi:hypothetical protein
MYNIKIRKINWQISLCIFYFIRVSWRKIIPYDKRILALTSLKHYVKNQTIHRREIVSNKTNKP